MPLYNCPISLYVPRVPVLTSEGITYDFVFIARSLLREVNDAIFDPTTHGAIEVLIYNRALKELNDQQMDDVAPLNIEDKNEIAFLYRRLAHRYPALKIKGLNALRHPLYDVFETSWHVASLFVRPAPNAIFSRIQAHLDAPPPPSEVLR